MALSTPLLNGHSDRATLFERMPHPDPVRRLEDELSGLCRRNISLAYLDKEQFASKKDVRGPYLFLSAEPGSVMPLVLRYQEIMASAGASHKPGFTTVFYGDDEQAARFQSSLRRDFGQHELAKSIVPVGVHTSITNLLEGEAESAWQTYLADCKAAPKRPLYAAVVRATQSNGSAPGIQVERRELTSRYSNRGVISSPADEAGIDFANYSIVVVENGYREGAHQGSLGDGLALLERIAQIGPKVPIIYQSDLPLGDYTEEERKRIADLGAIFMPQSVGFKTVAQRNRADREIEVSLYPMVSASLRQHLILSKAFPGIGPLEASGQYVVAAVAPEQLHDPKQPGRLAQAGLPDNLLTHKMYVLALFHSRLQALRNNSTLAPLDPDFIPAHVVADGLAAQFRDLDLPRDKVDALVNHDDGALRFDKRLGKLYDLSRRIARKQRDMPSTVLMHGNPVWDSWYGGTSPLLCEFGHAAAGHEQTDIALALLQPDSRFAVTLQPMITTLAADAYIKLRSVVDTEYAQKPQTVNDLDALVRERMVTEPLRVAATQNRDPATTLGLVDVAEFYAGTLR